MNKIIFDAEILKHEGMDAGYVEFPYNVQETVGARGWVKVKAIFDGKVEYRGSLAKMGKEYHWLGLTQEVRRKLGKSFGNTVHVELVKDIEERVVVVPVDAAALLDENPEAKKFYESLSYTNRKEYIRWIESAKREETRNNRLGVFIEKLKNKKKWDEK
jgi:hypothetical protein